jgi:hypothetical protein
MLVYAYQKKKSSFCLSTSPYVRKEPCFRCRCRHDPVCQAWRYETASFFARVVEGVVNIVIARGIARTLSLDKPGDSLAGDKDYPDFAKDAIQQCLADASLPYDVVQQACVGYVYGDSTCGQRALYTAGLTGIPIYNVNNNCSTGSTALFMAKQFVEGGLADCVMALGYLVFS